MPINADISIIKSSKREGRGDYKKTYTTEESGVFSNPESYEIELEVDNSRIGPSTPFNNAASIIQAIRKCVKFVLMGLQGTNYPVSYNEQNDVIKSYMYMLHTKSFNLEKRIYPSDFIGPSSYTLQMQNIAPLDKNINLPNIRKDYVVTDKADGERQLLYISAVGKIYAINTNMSVIFTGAITSEKTAFNTLLDGEIVSHDKAGKFINLYAAFDIYYVGRDDIRSLPFMPIQEGMGETEGEGEGEGEGESEEEGEGEGKGKKKEKRASTQKPTQSRYAMLKKLLSVLNPKSIIEDELCPLRIEAKKFYPEVVTNSPNAIFRACNTIMTRVDTGLFEYNTDGLIFTHAYFGVGANEIGAAGKLSKITWDYSFKWKPAEFNTIDFLVTTKKQINGEDIVTPIFEDGVNIGGLSDIPQFKTLVLRCGFDERKHGYLNPCQSVIEDKLPDFGENIDNEEQYKPVQFYPTNPFDARAGLCNVMLKKDDTGIPQMITEEGEVFQDNTIVEFKYDLNIKEGDWRWKPLRMRYDKTAELRQGLKNYGNAYHVADSNWKSIHNPITADMITNGLNIPDNMEDTDVYYNRTLSSTKTRSLRDFHNLYVKRLLIGSVSKKGDNLIDYACGKGGDFPKWIHANLSFVFGIDISKDNLENKLDGACARFLNNRKKFKHIPYALFVHGNSAQNIRSGQAMLNDKAVQITKAIFGEGAKDALGKGVARQYGKGVEGFQISSCQFAMHYFFENMTTFQNFLRNVSECTQVGGYFISTSYDGKSVFNMLKNRDTLGVTTDDGVKIWEVSKQYDNVEFADDSSCLGYKIDVFQESINKMMSEYLVNYDYLNRVMEDYGFNLVTREEAKSLGLPEGSGLFSELFLNMMEEVKMNRYKAKDYGDAMNMNAFEKKISFMNRYVVYKKIRNVNAANVELEEIEPGLVSSIVKKTESAKKKMIKKTLEKPEKPKKPRVRKLATKLVLSEDASSSSPAPSSAPATAVEPEPEPEPKPEPKKVRKPKTKKLLIIEE